MTFQKGNLPFVVVHARSENCERVERALAGQQHAVSCLLRERPLQGDLSPTPGVQVEWKISARGGRGKDQNSTCRTRT